MTDQKSDAFEMRLTAALQEYVAGARDARPAAQIADMAMRPRGIAARARTLRNARRLLLLGLAAVLLIPVAYLGAISLRRPMALANDKAVFVERVEGSSPGLDIIAAQTDGSEQLLRHLPDSIAPDGGQLMGYGVVSGTGWLAVGVSGIGQRWPMVLVDLRDPQSDPWVIEEASLGGIAPAWGPDGLVAALKHNGNGDLVLVDPETRTLRTLSMRGLGLVGGGPSILWTADGNGVLGSAPDSSYWVVPIDGSEPTRITGEIDGRGMWGPQFDSLRICQAGENCPGGDDGRVDDQRQDGSTGTVWQQQGSDRVLGAAFGAADADYWLLLDHNRGRQISAVHLVNGEQTSVTTINRDPSWTYVGAPAVAHDGLSAVLWLDLGGPSGAVVVPIGAGDASVHRGQFAGFVDGDVTGTFASGAYSAPLESIRPVDSAYALASVDDVIARQLATNPDQVVVAQGSRDGDATDNAEHDYTFTADQGGPSLDIHFDCFGPAPATLTSQLHEFTATSPCLTGTYETYSVISPGETLTVHATGDTTWRVVIFALVPKPGDTPPPVVQQAP